MEKYPSALSSHKDFTTEGFSFAVFEELVLCIILSVLAFGTDIASCWYIWLGAFVGCTLHFVVHIVQALWLRQYIPATYELEQEYSNTIEESEGCFLSEGQEDEEKTEQFQFLKLRNWYFKRRYVL